MAQVPLTVPPEVKERMREALGYGQPLYVQYWKWLVQFFWIEPQVWIDNTFGTTLAEGKQRIISWQTRSPVMDIVVQRMPQTLWVVGMSYVVGIAIALPAVQSLQPCCVVLQTRQTSLLAVHLCANDQNRCCDARTVAANLLCCLATSCKLSHFAGHASALTPLALAETAIARAVDAGPAVRAMRAAAALEMRKSKSALRPSTLLRP